MINNLWRLGKCLNKAFDKKANLDKSFVVYSVLPNILIFSDLASY